MAFLACMESAWNVPAVHVACTTLQPNRPSTVTVPLLKTHALLHTHRPWYVHIHSRDHAGMFTAVKPLADDGEEVLCVHASGAVIHVIGSIGQTAITLRMTWTPVHRKSIACVHARVMLFRAFSNDGQALVNAVYVPALRALQTTCDAIATASTNASMHAAATALIEAVLKRASVSVTSVPEFSSVELEELHEWVRRVTCAPRIRVPHVTHVPKRFMHSALESTFLATGAALLAAARHDSILVRCGAFMSSMESNQLRECVEAVSAMVQQVYSVECLDAAERESNSSGQWMRDIQTHARSISELANALMHKTV